jgi:hypothetical protein
MEMPMMGSVKEKKSEPAAELDELADAMSDLGEALADKDWTAAATAFRTAHTICASDYESDTDEG